MHRDGMIVGGNHGFHEAPCCRVRSARQVRRGRATTAASLGREAILNDTRTLDESKTREASGILTGREESALASAPFFGVDFPDFGGEAAGKVVALFGGDQAPALLLDRK